MDKVTLPTTYMCARHDTKPTIKKKVLPPSNGSAQCFINSSSAWGRSVNEASGEVWIDLSTHATCMYMNDQSLRLGKAKQLHLKTTLFFLKRKRRAASGGTRTRDVLHTVQMLYQLSHRGSSAGQAESLNVMQRQSCLSPDKQGNSISVLWSGPG